MNGVISARKTNPKIKIELKNANLWYL